MTTGDFEASKQRGIALATKGDYAAARDPLLDAAALDDSDPVVFNVLAACAFETGDYAAALADARVVGEYRDYARRYPRPAR